MSMRFWIRTSLFLTLAGLVLFACGFRLHPEALHNAKPRSPASSSLVTWRSRDSAAARWKQMTADNNSTWKQVLTMMKTNSPAQMKAKMHRKQAETEQALREMEGR